MASYTTPATPRTRLLAQRLLRGEGAAEITAYRAGETLSSVVHGVSGTGRIVVAHVPNLFGSIGAFHTPEAIDVRLDVLHDSADVALPLRVASLHLLGTLRWCRDTAEVEALRLSGPCADLVREVGPRVRVGVVESERCLLHDVSGVTAFSPQGLPVSAHGLVAGGEIADLQDDVLAAGPGVLADLADAVILGLLPGTSLLLATDAAGELPDAPAHCIDVDEHGVSVLRVRDGEVTSVHLALPGADRMDHSPRAAWRRLLDAVPARSAQH